MISNDKFIADATFFLKNLILTNVTDPILGNRTGTEKFVMTSYPQKDVNYPIITIVDTNTSQITKLGMGSEGQYLNVTMEIKVWARNVKERDALANTIIDLLRVNQRGTGSSTENGMYDFSLGSMTNSLDENVQGKVLDIIYSIIVI